MPANVVKNAKEEKIWKRKKKEVSEEKEKSQDEFSDQDWGLVNMLFQKAKKKYKGKELPKKYTTAYLMRVEAATRSRRATGE